MFTARAICGIADLTASATPASSTLIAASMSIVAILSILVLAGFGFSVDSFMLQSLDPTLFLPRAPHR